MKKHLENELKETKFSVKDLFPEAVKKHASQDSNLKVQYNVGDADADNVIISESFAKKILAEYPIDSTREPINATNDQLLAYAKIKLEEKNEKGIEHKTLKSLDERMSQDCKMERPYMASSKSDNMSAGKAIVDEFLSLGRHAEVTPEIELSKSAQEMASVDLCELNAMQTEEARFLHSSHYVTATDERITYPETPLVLQAFNNTDAYLTPKSITEIYSIKR